MTEKSPSDVEKSHSEFDLYRLFEILSENQDYNVKNLDTFLSRVFGLLLMFLDDEITPQQRQIWYMLCLNYPKSHSGLEIADSIGASKISKGIYNSIRALEDLNLINIDASRPRVFSVTANHEHTMSKVLIDLCMYYGNII